MFKKFALLSFLAPIAACTSYTEVTSPPQEVTFSSTSAQTASTGVSNATFRTTQSDADGDNEMEFSGASCAIDGSGFKASFVSPAIIKLPTYTGAADPLTVRCNAQGVAKSEVVAPRNLTLERIQGARTYSGGLAGALIGAAVRGVARSTRDPLNDDFAYPDTTIIQFDDTVQ